MKNLWIILLFFGLSAYSQNIYYFKIEGEIAAPIEILVDTALHQARRMKAAYVIVEINTFGGRVDVADAVNQKILDFEKPVWAFINNNAYSAGAMIAIACDSIYMAQGANIGAVTPINGATGQYASEKIKSAIRGKMRASAEANKRNPQIAEAMVDETLEYDSLVTPGKLLVFTTAEAIKAGYCEGQANSLEDILSRNGMAKANVIKYKESILEQIISFFLNPVVSSILVLLIIGGIYLELQAPGIGLPLAAAIVGFVLYFVPYYIRGFAENWELFLFLAGVVLVALELLLFPGIKVVLAIGIVIMFLALALMTVGNVGFSLEGVSTKGLTNAAIVMLVGMVGSFALIAVLAPQIATSKRFSHVTLQTTLDSKKGYVSAHLPTMVGKIGESYTVLRPSGKVSIDDKIFDASTQGDFIDKNTAIVVVGQEGVELIVKVQQNIITSEASLLKV